MEQQGTTLGSLYGHDFEELLVWMLLHDPEYAAHTLPVLSDSTFEHTPLSHIVDVFQVLHEAFGVVSPRVVLTEMQKVHLSLPAQSTQRVEYEEGLRKLIKIIRSTYDAADIKYVKDTTGNFIRRSEMRQALLESVKLWEHNDYEAIGEKVAAAVSSSASYLNSATDMGVSFDSLKDRMKRYIEKSASTKQAPLDIPTLDKLMRGGLDSGNIGIVMAPPGRGKSLLLVQAGAAAVMRGLSVALVSLELSEIDYAQRFDARFTGIPINTIHADPLGHARAMLIGCRKFMKGRLQVKYMPADETAVGDIKIWLQQLKAHKQFVPDVLIIDYLDLLKHSTQRGDRSDIGHTTRALRTLGTQMPVSVWTASQTNRGGIAKLRLGLEDTSEDIQKTFVADVILGLAQSPVEKDIGECRIIMLKNRQGGGEGKTAKCKITTSTMTVEQSHVQQSLTP